VLARGTFGKNLSNPATLCFLYLEILAVVTMKFDIFLDVTPSKLVVLYRCIREVFLIRRYTYSRLCSKIFQKLKT